LVWWNGATITKEKGAANGTACHYWVETMTMILKQKRYVNATTITKEKGAANGTAGHYWVEAMTMS
jgi:hypothetical protein